MPSLFSLLHLALVPSLALLALTASAASAIVDTPYVVEAIGRNAIVWDVRAAAAYKQGHIPGAVNIGDVGKVLRDENTEDYLAKPTIESLLGGAGIDRHAHASGDHVHGSGLDVDDADGRDGTLDGGRRRADLEDVLRRSDERVATASHRHGPRVASFPVEHPLATHDPDDPRR